MLLCARTVRLLMRQLVQQVDFSRDEEVWRRRGLGGEKMAGERAQQIRQAAEEATTAAVNEWQDSGALQHLHGQPLDLSDDSPDWLLHRMLKEQGFSLPIIERGKDLDEAQRRATAIVERLRRRRAWLDRPEARCTLQQVHAFNASRLHALEEYRAALGELNRAIRDYNLMAPSALHRRGYIVDQIVAGVAQEIPPLDEPAPAPAPAAAPSWVRAVWRRTQGAP